MSVSRFDTQVISYSFIPQSVLRKALGLFQSKLSTESDLVFPLSIASILSFH